MPKNCGTIVQKIIIAGLLVFLPANCLRAGLTPGDRAPDFELPDLNGRTVSLSDILRTDKPVVLSFFGSWCDSCLKEITDAAEIAAQHGAVVYLVGVDADKEKVVRFMQKHKITFPVIWDAKARTTGRKYDIVRGAFVVVPKAFIISPAGTIEYVAEGYDAAGKAALKKKLAEVSAKKWEKPSEVAVFFTGSANGCVEPSYSNKQSSGGFVKLISFLSQQLPKYPAHILLDSGDFLPYGATAAQAGSIFKAMALARYDAVAVGDQDLAYKGFVAEVKKKDEAFISSNISFKGGAIGRLDKTVMAGNLKIRIVSFISPETFSLYPEAFTAKLKFRELKEVLNGKNADYLILISHAGLEENKKIAAEFGQIDMIIAGHSQELIKEPVKAGNTLIVQSGGNLQDVGRIVLRFDSKGKFLDYSHDVIPLTNSIPDSPQVEAIIRGAKIPR